MSTGPLVEDCFSLSPADVNRNLYRIRKIGSGIDPRRSDIDYWIDEDDDNSYLFITIGGSEPQRIIIEEVEVAFGGFRQYFVCDCGKRIIKIYLPQGKKEFKCKKCHQLKYFLTTFSHKSIHGMARYNFSRMNKLSQHRATMGTVMYNGSFTKKFQRFLRMCDRAGIKDVVRNAIGLMENIKSFQKQH